MKGDILGENENTLYDHDPKYIEQNLNTESINSIFGGGKSTNSKIWSLRYECYNTLSPSNTHNTGQLNYNMHQAIGTLEFVYNVNPLKKYEN